MNCRNYSLKKFSFIVYNIKHNSPYCRQIIHRHNYFEILLFKEGKNGTQIIDFKEYKNKDQTAFIVMPGQVHLSVFLPEETGIMLQFTKEFLELSVLSFQLNWFLKFQTNPKIILDTLQFKKLYSHFKKIKVLYDDETSKFKIQKLQKLFGLIFFELLEIIPDTVKLNNKKDLSSEFMSLVMDNFKEIRLVNKYANLLDTPINKLQKEVKKHFGKSPLEIINELLIIEVKRLLLMDELIHKEIAFTLNFDSQGSYTRFVKVHTQMTPTELKKKYQKTNTTFEERG